MVYIYKKYSVWFIDRENKVYGLQTEKIYCMVYDKRKQSVWFIYIENILYGLQIEKNILYGL